MSNALGISITISENAFFFIIFCNAVLPVHDYVRVIASVVQGEFVPLFEQGESVSLL